MTLAVDRDRAFVATAARIGDDVAALHADDVDRAARFPAEALDTLREERMLSALVPGELGGGGVSFEAVAHACFELGRRCGATAMVFAMHQIQVATIVRHLDGAAWFEHYLRDLAAEQRLVASVTSEVGTGGDMGSSIAAIQAGPDGAVRFEKQAPTVSYGAHADDLLTTLRRAPDAEPGDQVLVLTRRGQHTLDPSGTWDPLGMRGTCSPGFVVRAELAPEQLLPTPFATAMTTSMVPVSHVLWSHVWLGIATDAFDRARAFVRAAARRSPGVTPPAAHQLSHVLTELSLLRAEIDLALRELCELSAEPGRERLGTMATVLRFNNLKIAASEKAPAICQAALRIAGIAGFRNDTPYSVGRHLRDALSASLMIANERIHATNAGLLLISKGV
ncbi:MAG: acyl-CoA dehydrogenase family protein [Solirubrobacteraceae bacterium]